ncbi:MAG TPA: TIGR03118 family protein [Tepidisphaeraceae bacterium]|jgi:uncharacterized protein (TIGR03118 family)
MRTLTQTRTTSASTSALIESLEARELLASATHRVLAQINFVADPTGTAVRHDADLVNPWGLAFGTASGFWVANNGSGKATAFDANGVTQSTVVTLPTAGTEPNSTPTGVVANTGAGFQLSNGSAAQFIYVGEDGLITGSNAASGTSALVAVDNSAGGSIYKGVTIGQINGADALFAADFHNGKIDVFDSTFKPMTLTTGAFTDSQVPAGFAPFNVQNLGGKIYVTYAKQDAAKEDDVPGAGNGFVDVFDTSGTVLTRFSHASRLDSPWGLEIAPAGFGKYSGDVLVGQFGSGEILAFDATTGNFQSILRGKHDHRVRIDGLWSLKFGNGTTSGSAKSLFFTAGTNGEAGGLFGRLKLTTEKVAKA